MGCLVPIVLLSIAVLVLLPTLREKWSTFQDENPWVAQVPGVAGVLKDVLASRETDNDSSSAASTNPSGRAIRRLEGVNDRTAMPSDLPLWPKPKDETFSSGEDHAAAYQRVRQPSDSVLRFFRGSMPSKGWRLDKERKAAGSTLLLYRKSNRIARVEVVADSAGTDVWLRSRTISQSARP